MTAPAISIVVPCHNGGRFLDTMLASLEAQSFRDFEVVIVNDGSTEPETLHKLDELRGRFRVIDQENRYLAGARNTGFRAAQADMVLPLDCDDTLDPSYLSEVTAALRVAPPDVGFVFTHMQLAGALEGVLHSRFDRFDQMFLNRLPYCMLIRKAAWAKVGGYDETMRDGMEDWEFNIRLAAGGYRGLEIPKPLFVYNVRADGMLLSKSARMQGTLWSHVYGRHKELYAPRTLLSIWRRSRRSWKSMLYAVGWLTTINVLPQKLFNAFCYRLILTARAWRLATGIIRRRSPQL